MPVVWLDPFMHISDTTSWGNGTTSNTIRNGSYASPFRFQDFYGNSSGNASVNGTTLAANTEVKIKGKSLGDLTNSLGSFYVNYYPRLYAATGNTEWASNYNQNGAAFLIPFNDSLGHVQKLLPTGYTPVGDFLVLWGYGWTYSSYVGVANSYMEGVANAIYDAGYSSASNPFSNTLYQIKQQIGGYEDQNWSGGDKYYMFKCQNLIKVSAGWVSETETSASGYSYYTMYQYDAYENIYFQGNSDCDWDLSRLIWKGNRREYMWFNPAKTGVTHNAPLAWKGYSTSSLERVEANNNTIKCTNFGQSNVYVKNGGTVELPLNGRHPRLIFHDTNANNTIKQGSTYSDSSASDMNGFFYNMYNSTSQAGTLETMNGATYYAQSTATNTAGFNFGHSTYASGNVNFSIVGTPYRAGQSGGFMSGISSSLASRNPVAGNFLSTRNTGLYQKNIAYAPTNWWENTKLDLSFAADNPNFRLVAPLGKLLMNGSDYRTTNSTITNAQNQGRQTSPTGYQNVVYAFETNDYDQKPIALLHAEYEQTRTPALAFNETISGTEHLCIKASGTTTLVRYPIEVPVPSHTAGSNNIRLKMKCYHYTGAQQVNVQLEYFIRKDDDGDDVYYGHGSNVGLTLASNANDSSNPLIYTANIPQSASGVREINSIMAYIMCYFVGTTHNNRILIEYLIAETY